MPVTLNEKEKTTLWFLIAGLFFFTTGSAILLGWAGPLLVGGAILMFLGAVGLRDV